MNESSIKGLAAKRRISKQATGLHAQAITKELLFDRQLREKMLIGDGVG